MSSTFWNIINKVINQSHWITLPLSLFEFWYKSRRQDKFEQKENENSTFMSQETLSLRNTYICV